MTNDNNAVAGRALYLEFSHTTTVYQMLMVPSGTASFGRKTGVVVYRRQLNPGVSRKTWRVTRPHIVTPLSYDEAHSKDVVSSYARDVVSNVSDSVMQQFISRGWKLVKEPIVVEMTNVDYDSVLVGKIPYKVLGRVNKVRKQLGFVDTWK